MAIEVGHAFAVREGRLPRLLPVLFFLACAVLASLFFRGFPQADMAVSLWFYRPGDGFYLARDPWLLTIREIHLAVPYLCAASALGALAVQLMPRNLGLRLSLPAPSSCLYVSGVMLLGPGLLVHTLKDLVGRARPRELLEFGGQAAFTLPWELSDACRDNCSFISGEGASGAALLALPLLLKRDRLAALAVVLPYSLFVSINRIAFGAHFLSDVVIGWCLILALICLLRHVHFTLGEKLDARFARFSSW